MGYGGERGATTPAMRCGLDNKRSARTASAYIEDRSKSGEDMEVQDSGLTLHQEMDFLGASADGIIT